MNKRIYTGAGLLALLLVALISGLLYRDQLSPAEASSGAYVVHTSGELAGINVDKEQFTLVNVSGAAEENGNTCGGTITFSCWYSQLFQELRDVVPLGTRITVIHSPEKCVSANGEIVCSNFSFETEGGVYASWDEATKRATQSVPQRNQYGERQK